MRRRVAVFTHRTFAALRRRNYRLYFIGQSISLAGNWMQSVAQSWLVLHLTGSGTALGIVTALQYGPILFLGPYAGVLADRLPKRRILYATQGLSGLVAFVLGVSVATGSATAGLVYAMAAVLGFVTALDYPVRQTFFFELVGRREMLSAVGLSGMMTNLARVAGPALAGVLIATVGLAACFLVNAGTAIVSIACVLLMRPGEFTPIQALSGQYSGTLREGFGYAVRMPIVREVLIMMAVVGVLTYEFGVTLPLLAKYTLGGEADALAWIMSSMGLGAAAGGLLTAGRRGEGLKRLSLIALAFGVVTAAVGLASTLPVVCGLMVLVGVFSARFIGLSNATLQLTSDPAMRNRVVALWSSVFLGSTFLGGPLIGWIGEVAGTSAAFSVGVIGGVIAAAMGWRSLRRTAALGSMGMSAEVTNAPAGAASSSSGCGDGEGTPGPTGTVAA